MKRKPGDRLRRALLGSPETPLFNLVLADQQQPQKRRGRPHGSYRIDPVKARAIAVAIDWGGMKPSDILRILPPGEKILGPFQWLSRRRDRGRELLGKTVEIGPYRFPVERVASAFRASDAADRKTLFEDLLRKVR